MNYATDRWCGSLFISLFNPDSSGTMSYRNRWLTMELDIKHAAEWGRQPAFLNYQNSIITMWLPWRWRCQGWRIIIRPAPPK